MIELILAALAIPFVCGLAVLAVRRPAAAAWFNLCGSLLTSATLVWIVRRFVAQGPFHQGGFMLDALNVLFLLIVAVLSLTAALYSIPYMAHELRDGHLTEKMIPRYFFLFQFFVLTMILTLMMENLGL